MTKLADNKPPYCASCFRHPEGRSVDFEAHYDGPVIPGTPAPVPVDDLVLCEKCLSEAFAILDPQNLKETVAELQQIVLDLLEDIEAKDKIIVGAKSTIGELVDHPVARGSGKPILFGVSDEVRAKITRARYQRKGSSPAPHNPAFARKKAKTDSAKAAA